MTGCNNGWDEWYGPGYHNLSPSEQQHIDKLKELLKDRRKAKFEQELDDYEERWEHEEV